MNGSQTAAPATRSDRLIAASKRLIGTLAVLGTAIAACATAASAELPIEAKCEFIDTPGTSECMVPFPDDYYTKADPTSPTGRRLDFRELGTPTNVAGQHIEAAPYNAGDGFSPGSAIVVKVPGIQTTDDVAAMKAVPINNLRRYRAANAPVVVIDASTGQRWPIWVEIDSTAKPEKANLEIHPAVNFTSGHRYIVALRNLKNAKKQRLQAPAGFRYYRDGLPSGEEKVNERRPHFEEIFAKLQAAGIQRQSLYLAWDFTVASDENNARRVLSMRNRAFSALGDNNLADGIVQGNSPTFAVTEVKNEPFPGEIARIVKGDVVVPCYLFPSCAPGGTMELNSEGLPIENGVWSANFICIIPAAAATGAGESARPSLYGHGLFGSAGEVEAGAERSLSARHDIVQCATTEIGMSEEDVPVAVTALQNLSNFSKITDRLQQGLLDELYLGRAMISPGGFTTNEAFHQNGTLATPSVLNIKHLYYNGNSQGGIMGGALTAISPDFTRASLGVPAMNYSVLLDRSSDFDSYAEILYPNYPDEEARPLIFDMMQLLWDRGEPDGYAERMTSNPLPDTPPHQVLLDVAFGDHQVTDYQADVEARTIGARAHQPTLYAGRWPSTNVLWNVPAIKRYPFTGSAVYYWDSGPVRESPPGSHNFVGTEPPPYENLPNRTGEDPHELPRAAAAEQQLVSDFFEGDIKGTDNCGGGPCYSNGFTGP
jgi:hypothetical protein